MYKLLLAITLFSACRKDDHALALQNEFPNQVGNHWVYRFSGYPENTDSIFVDIIGTSRLPNGESATIWTTKFATFTDTSYVTSTAHEAVFYPSPCWSCTPTMPTPKLRYVFPLQVGNQWLSAGVGGDTIKVLSQSSVLVGKTGYTAYVLTKTRQPAVNASTQDTLWFVPSVGMVRLQQREYNLGPLPGNGTWELARVNTTN